jgi:hypothetical protein
MEGHSSRRERSHWWTRVQASFDDHEGARHLYCELGGERIGKGHKEMKRLCREFELEPLLHHAFDFFWRAAGSKIALRSDSGPSRRGLRTRSLLSEKRQKTGVLGPRRFWIERIGGRSFGTGASVAWWGLNRRDKEQRQGHKFEASTRCGNLRSFRSF